MLVTGSDNSITGDGARMIVAALKANTTLSTLTLDSIQSVTMRTVFLHCSTTGNGIGDFGVFLFSIFLRHRQPSLTVLDLRSSIELI